jgi:hypothetical protein
LHQIPACNSGRVREDLALLQAQWTADAYHYRF